MSKIYNGRRRGNTVRALDDVSFTLTPGIYGLLGPNGAGKSTLISIITGSLVQDSGSVLWNGVPTRQLGIKYRRILGFMPQQQNLYEGFTGRRFLHYVCALKEIPTKQAEGQSRQAAAAVNLTGELDKRLGAYSGGMKQRLLAAAAMLGNPQLLIMDEPTAGLDPKERVRLRELLASFSQSKIIIVATHVVSDVESVSKEIILLRKGNIVAQNNSTALAKRYAPGGGLEDVYLSVFGEEA